MNLQGWWIRAWALFKKNTWVVLAVERREILDLVHILWESKYTVYSFIFIV